MVCQLRTLVYSLGLNNPLRICLTPRKSRVNNIWRNKQGNCRCKMAGDGFHSLAKLRAQMCTAGRGNPRCLDRRLLWIKKTVLWLATDRSQNLRADCHRPDLYVLYSLLPKLGIFSATYCQFPSTNFFHQFRGIVLTSSCHKYALLHFAGTFVVD
jgi:hypothetical protein